VAGRPAGVGGGSLQCPFFDVKAAAYAIAYELCALYLQDSSSTQDRPVHFTVSRCGQFFASGTLNIASSVLYSPALRIALVLTNVIFLFLCFRKLFS
jgi:hypothetical protein